MLKFINSFKSSGVNKGMRKTQEQLGKLCQTPAYLDVQAENRGESQSYAQKTSNP